MAYQQQGKRIRTAYSSKRKVRLIAIESRRENEVLRFALLFLVTVSLYLLSQIARAEASINPNELFVPDEFVFFKPGGESFKNKNCKDIIPQMMDNEALYQAVADLKNTNASTSHRALNHQWLRSHHNQDNFERGGRALSKVVKLGLYSYIEKLKKNKQGLVSSASNMAEKVAVEDMQYDFKVSGNKLNLSVKYEF